MGPSRGHAILLVLHGLSANARPNPRGSPVLPRQIEASITQGPTTYTSLPESYFADLTAIANYSIPASELAAESAFYASETAAYASYTSAYASYTANFYRTAQPSDLARLSSYYAAQSSDYAAFTSDFYGTDLAEETIGTSEAAVLSSEYAQWTSELAVYATYTGTDDPFVTATPASNASVPRASPANATVAPTATAGWPALTRVESPKAYGAHCLQYYAAGKEYLRSQCDSNIPQICDLLGQANAGTGDVDKWVYAYGNSSTCVMGFWLPKVAAGTGKVPTVAECKKQVFGKMVDLCIGAPQDPLGLYNAAGVNVDVLPDHGQTGVQIDSGAPSYLMAAV